MSAAPENAGFQPWLGLLPYNEADKELFFGRDADTQDLLRLVRREVVTVLFGRSGTGKSSLLRAGVFPKLRDEQYLPIWLRLDHSGRTSYGGQVRAAIESAVATHHIEVETLNEALADESNDFWEYLHRMVFWDAKNQPVTPVLVFDQFEELFTVGRNRPELVAFFDELAAVAENLVPQRLRDLVVVGLAKLPAVYNERHYKLIVSLREDYVSQLDTLSKDMPSVMHNRHALTHMTGEQALEVVMKPGGDLVDETVARGIVRFVAAANDAETGTTTTGGEDSNVDLANLRIEPALLSLVCSELNLQRIKESRPSITLEQVKRSSTQILEDFYERSLEGMEPEDRRFIEDRLVTAAGFRTTVPVEDANAAGLDNDEIEKLIARRLIRPEDRLGRPNIELTHDVLTKVVTHSRALRQQHEALEEMRQKQIELDAEKQRERLQRNNMRTLRLVGVLAFALAVVAVVLLVSRRKIETARKETAARAMALNAIGVSRQDPELALLLSLEAAMATFPDTTKTTVAAPREIESALRTATRESLIRRRFEGHTSKVFSVAFDKEGKRLVTGAWHPDSTARVWDVDSGKEIARLDLAAQGEKTTVSCACFSPDGRKIVTTTYRNDGAVFLWDASAMHLSGTEPMIVTQPLIAFYGHHSPVTSADFSPDGKRVATGGNDKLVRVWDLETGKELCAPLGSGRIRHTKRIRSVVFSADGTKLLSTSDDGNAILWDVTAAIRAGIPADPNVLEVVQIFTGNGDDTLHDGAISPSGKLVATVGNDFDLRVWDAATGAPLAAQTHSDAPMGVAFIGDNELVTICNDSFIRFWHLGTAADEEIGSQNPNASAVKLLRLVGAQSGHRGWIRGISVSGDHRFIATCGDDATARLWKIPPGGETAVLSGPDFSSWAADLHLTSATKDKPQRLLAYVGTTDGGVLGFDAYTERKLEPWVQLTPDSIHHTSPVRSLSVSPDGTQLVTASSDQTAIVWNAENGQPAFVISGHKGPAGGSVYQARFSPDGSRIVTVSNEGCARIWNARTGEPDEILITPQGKFDGGAIANFSKLLESLRTAASPAAAFIVSRLTESQRAALADPTADSGALKTIIAGVLDEMIRGPSLDAEPAWSAVVRRPMTTAWSERHPSGDDLKTLNRLLIEDVFPKVFPDRGIYDASFSNDGNRIVTADFQARTATLWDAHRGKALRLFPSNPDPQKGHSDSVMGASFNAAGSQIATASTDGYARIWDVKTGALLKSIRQGSAVRSAVFHPDGGLLLTAGADGIARLWNLADGKLRTELHGHKDTISEAKFSSDGSYIVTSSRDGVPRVFLTNPWWLYDLATQRVTRKLTEAERDQYEVKRKLTPEERAYYLAHPQAKE